ncbi:hypothetical protein J26TS2_18950 [Shouchella clausii]|nr:hypothetical protein J26TS2_18950 [Shouchella clausii]
MSKGIGAIARFKTPSPPFLRLKSWENPLFYILKEQKKLSVVSNGSRQPTGSVLAMAYY